jgi:hypothetical protein
MSEGKTVKPLVGPPNETSEEMPSRKVEMSPEEKRATELIGELYSIIQDILFELASLETKDTYSREDLKDLFALCRELAKKFKEIIKLAKARREKSAEK